MSNSHQSRLHPTRLSPTEAHLLSSLNNAQVPGSPPSHHHLQPRPSHQSLRSQTYHSHSHSHSPSPHSEPSTLSCHRTTSKEHKILLYNIQTHSFRTAYPSILLSGSSHLRHRQLQPTGQATEIHWQEVGAGRSNAHTLLSPTIRQSGDDNDWDHETEAEYSGRGASRRSFSLKSAPKTITRFLRRSSSAATNCERIKEKDKPRPKSRPQDKEIPISEYDWSNPPLLTSSPTNPRYMIISLPRWTRVLEFNWRTRTYGLSEEEKRQGTSVVYTRRQKLPAWVWVGRNVGCEVKGGCMGEKWAEVWVERGA